MSDYYDILGIPRDASEEQVRVAYKRKALEHHPDKGGDKEQFQKIKEAYETLADPVKRQQYDNPGNGFPDIFGHAFFHHQQQRRQCSNTSFTCRVTLEDVYFGSSKRFRIKRERLCEKCNVRCSYCKGSGSVTQQMQLGPFTQIFKHNCEPCKGSGLKDRHDNNECNGCGGTGKLREEQIVEVAIEKGMMSGKQVVVEGWGEQAYKQGEESGNLIITIVVDEHAHFKRLDNGKDLLYNVDITFLESIIGKCIVIPHFGGDLPIEIAGFGVINPLKRYTICGKGLESGNLHIIFKISYPEKSITLNNEEKAVLTKLLS